MDTRLPTAGELDALGADDFARTLAPLFEGAPAFVARLAMDRPFGSYTALLDRAGVLAQTMPEAEQITLLDAHPRIGAPPDSVSALSFREQGYDGLSGHAGAPALAATADEEVARHELDLRLERLNTAYEERFGFRYVVHVAGRSRHEIAALMERQLHEDRDAEKRRALQDVVDIARDRLARLGGNEGAG